MHKINSNMMALLLSVTLAVLAIVGVFFSRASYGGVGFSIALFLLLLLVALVVLSMSENVFFHRSFLHVVKAYIFFVYIMGVAFVLSDSTTSLDVHYVASTASNIFWVICCVLIYQQSPKMFLNFSYLFSVFVSLLIILYWMYGVVVTSDIFFLRNDEVSLSEFSNTVLRNPNQAARNAATLMPLVILFFFNQRRSLYARYFLISIALCLVLVVVSTLSRANFLTLLIFLVGVFVLRDQHRTARGNIGWAKGVIFGALIVFLGVISSASLQNRIVSVIDMFGRTMDIVAEDDGRMLPKRVRTWKATIMIISDHPLIGVGRSNEFAYQKQYGGVAYSSGEPTAMAIHGGFLKIAAYAGIFSLIFFCYFFYSFIRFSKKQKKNTEIHSFRYIASICLATLVFMLIPMNIGADSFGMPITWLSLGILTAFSHGTRKVNY